MKYEVVLRESEEGFSVPCPGVALIRFFSPESPPPQPPLPSPHHPGERVRVRGNFRAVPNELHPWFESGRTRCSQPADRL
jgi:hypothetical protein